MKCSEMQYSSTKSTNVDGAPVKLQYCSTKSNTNGRSFWCSHGSLYTIAQSQPGALQAQMPLNQASRFSTWCFHFGWLSWVVLLLQYIYLQIMRFSRPVLQFHYISHPVFLIQLSSIAISKHFISKLVDLVEPYCNLNTLHATISSSSWIVLELQYISYPMYWNCNTAQLYQLISMWNCKLN